MGKNISKDTESFSEFIQQDKNYTKSTTPKPDTQNNNNISPKSKKVFKGAPSEEDIIKKIEEERERAVTSQLLSLQQTIWGWQQDENQRKMNDLWEMFPGGITREEARFRAALNPNTHTVAPQQVSYEEARDRFDAYDYYVENPIKAKDFYNLNDKIKNDLTYVEPPSSDEYMIFLNPEDLGYVRPNNTIYKEIDKSIYNTELELRYNNYLEEGKKNIDLDAMADSTWDSYLQNLRGNNGSRFNSALDLYYDYHNTDVRTYGKFNNLEPVIHTSNITNKILESFPKDANGRILINGETFPEYFVYKQIFNTASSKFGDALMRDSENPDGLGRLYLNDIYKKEYGITYDDFIYDTYYSRIKEIRKEIADLRDRTVKEFATETSNATQRGLNSMNSVIPHKLKKSISDSSAKKSIAQPFNDVIEELDATMSSIEGGKFVKGFSEGFDFTNMLSLGLNEVGIGVNKLEILNKVNNNQPLSKKEQTLFELIKYEKELEDLYKGLNIKKPVWAEIASGVGTFVADMPMFATLMGATEGIGASVKYGTNFALKKFVKEKTFDTAKNLVKRAIIDFNKAYAVNAVRGAITAPFSSITYRSYIDKALSQYSLDENGNLKFTPKNKWAMAAGAFLEGTNEIASEYWGGAFDDIISLGSKAFGRATGISKWLNKTEAGAWLRRAAQSPMSAATKKTLRNLGYTGILSEPLSEVWGDFMTNIELMFLDNAVNLVKDGKNFKWKKEGRSFDTEYSFENFKDPDYWITIMGVSTISGGAMTSVAAGRNILTQAKYAKQLVRNKNKALNEIKNEELKNTLRLLGDSENFVNAAIELANFDWEGKGISLADKTNAINYIRMSYTLQTTMGDMEGQRHMEAFEGVMSELYSREYTPNGKHTGHIYQAADSQANMYDVLDGNIEDRGAVIKVRNENGEITEIPNSELIHLGHTNIEDIMITEYDNRFSTESEMARLNTARQSFNRIANPSEKDIRRVTSEFGIRKPSVGKTVKLVDGTEATIEEDLQNGRYKIKKYNQETTEFEEVEIPVYDILSNNPISAAAQKKQYEKVREALDAGNQEAAQEVYKSPEEKANDIINGDYDSRLFDDKGAVKLDDQQIINNFSLEDPASLEDYINKVGNRVSPQVRQSLNNALKLSRIHNEINPQLSHLVQTSKNRTDVAILSNILSQEIITSDPNITAEELLESIINNSNYNSKIRHDFKNILKALTNAKVQRRTTTKTKTSVTQKDVIGKRGRKQIEKGIKDLKKALKDNNPIEALNTINRIDNNLSKVEDEPITDKEKQFVEETRRTLKEQGYEIQPMRGMNYHSGLKATVEFEINPELPAGTQIIKGVRKPQINKDGVMVQAAEIVVEQGPAIEEETPDISQAVTKEMTKEEPMDFSEPTDNTVEPKKEDSIPQDTTEQEFTIPELERAFAIPDSDKLIETPSREEEVETLTDEQRAQVRIHNENGTDLVDYISDSALPDDQSTDEVIVDKHELQGNRIYRYNGEQLRNNQAQVRRTPNKEGDNHDLVYKWLDENSIDLQGIIDNELAAIAALDTDVRFMMMTAGTKSGYSAGSPMLNTVFQVVEYTDVIKKIHNEKRGGVITSNGKEYLLIGITGFSTPKPGIFNPEAAHYNFITDKVLKTARNNYTSQTDEISRDAYYVHPTMFTKIKNIEAGWIVTQTTEDSGKQSRSLGELLADETRNPYGITAANSKWLIPTRNSAKPIKVRVDPTDVVHGLKIPTGLAGSLFLLVPAANGHYIPISVKIQTTNELVDGTLKDTIWEVAQNLLSTEKETRDYAIKELCKLLNLTKEGYNIFIDDSEIDFDNPNSAKIVFTQNGRRMATEIPLSSPNASAELYNTIFSNIPFQLNIGLQTLVSGELQAYIDAGALITDVALLGTTNASYTVHSIGPDLKADPYTENSIESQEGSYENSDLRRTQDNGIINYGNNSYFRMAEDQYVNTKTGEPVTDVKTIREIKTHVWLEKSKPTPAKIEQGSKARLYIIGENEVISVSKKGIITFYSEERSIDIIDEINRENIEESRINNAVEELARIEEQQQAEQVIQQELQEEKDASVSKVNFTENFDVFNTPEVAPVEDTFTEVSFEETSNPKEEVSATFTEGVVENTDVSQLYIDDYLVNIEEQLIAEGMSEEEINTFMDKILLQLEEHGMGTYYTKDQESNIKTIIDNIKNCH